MRPGIIGLGDIGGNLAAWLARTGHEIHGFDIDPAASERAAARGVRIAASRRELIERADLVVTSLASLPAIEESYFAADGLVALQRDGLLTLECSTVPPEFARRITAARKDAGGVAIEASVIGIGKDAEAGQLYFLVSGAPDDVESARPFLDAAGRGWRLVGPSGTAAIAKVLNNSVGAVTMCAIAEALALAQAHGIAPDVLVEVMQTGAGAGKSVVLDRHGAFMAGAMPPRPFNPIAKKDAAALGAILKPGEAGALPMLATMVETYRALEASDVAAPEQLAAAARHRLADR